MEIDVLRYFLMCGKKGKIIVRLCLEDAERMFGRAALGGCSPRQRAILLIMLRPLRAPRGN